MSAPGIIEDDDIVLGWIVSALGSNGILTSLLGDPSYIAEPVAPPEWGEGPMVVCTLMSGLDVRGVGTARIMANDLWLVKAVARAENARVAAQIANQIDLSLSDTTAHVDGGTILMSHREGRYRSGPVDEQGTTWRSLGGFYRIYSQ